MSGIPDSRGVYPSKLEAAAQAATCATCAELQVQQRKLADALRAVREAINAAAKGLALVELRASSVEAAAIRAGNRCEASR